MTTEKKDITKYIDQLTELISTINEKVQTIDEVIQELKDKKFLKKTDEEKIKANKEKARAYQKTLRESGYFKEYEEKKKELAKKLPKTECPHCGKMVKYLTQHISYNHPEIEE